MAQNYYSVEKAAEVLGVSPDEVKQMRERQELYGYRDGASWKFKAEDVERVAQERREGGHGGEEESDDVLLSERELGHSGHSSSGTVIGMNDGKNMSDESDIQIHITPESKAPSQDDLTYNESELVAEDDDLTLDDSNLDISAGASSGKGSAPAVTEGNAPQASPTADSSLDLSKGGDDDALVLSGSGSGSDVTIGGDSGISLVDPADSGLSLEAPLDLGPGSDESLELGEDDILTTAEEANLSSPTMLRSDEDFLLTPLSDGTEDDDASSGSQVIALDAENPDEMGAFPVGPATASMVDMLEEGATPGMAPIMGAGAGMAAAGVYPDGGMVATIPSLPEEPYSVADMVLLSACVVLLCLCGMMVYDLVRNIWGWESGTSISSALMDMVLGMIDK